MGPASTHPAEKNAPAAILAARAMRLASRPGEQAPPTGATPITARQAGSMHGPRSLVGCILGGDGHHDLAVPDQALKLAKTVKSLYIAISQHMKFWNRCLIRHGSNAP